MNVLLLGKSKLNLYIYPCLINYSFNVFIISCRSMLKGEQLPINPDVIIDSLDPPSSSFDNYLDLCCSITELRRRISRDHADKPYYYISSSNVYDLSYSLIDEDCDLLLSPSCYYLQNKIHTENMITQLFSRASLLRLCSMWQEAAYGNDNSFFSDLISARKSLSTLPLREDDDKIISFMHYNEAAKTIARLVVDCKLYPVQNITEYRWSSRALLKYPNCSSMKSQTLMVANCF